MSTANLDLRQNNVLTISIDHNVSDRISIGDFKNIDTGYKATIGDVEFSTENGKIVISGQRVVLLISQNDFTVGTHIGYLESISREGGVYFKLKIKVRCYDNY